MATAQCVCARLCVFGVHQAQYTIQLQSGVYGFSDCGVLCECMRVRLCPSHQDAVLDVVAQQACIIEGVLGFLHSGVHGPFLDLVLDGSEQFVQRLACRVLVHIHTHKQERTYTHTQLFKSCLRTLPSAVISGSGDRLMDIINTSGEIH